MQHSASVGTPFLEKNNLELVICFTRHILANRICSKFKIIREGCRRKYCCGKTDKQMVLLFNYPKKHHSKTKKQWSNRILSLLDFYIQASKDFFLCDLFFPHALPLLKLIGSCSSSSASISFSFSK